MRFMKALAGFLIGLLCTTVFVVVASSLGNAIESDTLPSRNLTRKGDAQSLMKIYPMNSAIQFNPEAKSSPPRVVKSEDSKLYTKFSPSHGIKPRPSKSNTGSYDAQKLKNEANISSIENLQLQQLVNTDDFDSAHLSQVQVEPVVTFSEDIPFIVPEELLSLIPEGVDKVPEDVVEEHYPEYFQLLPIQNVEVNREITNFDTGPFITMHPRNQTFQYFGEWEIVQLEWELNSLSQNVLNTFEIHNYRLPTNESLSANTSISYPEDFELFWSNRWTPGGIVFYQFYFDTELAIIAFIVKETSIQRYVKLETQETVVNGTVREITTAFRSIETLVVSNTQYIQLQYVFNDILPPYFTSTPEFGNTIEQNEQGSSCRSTVNNPYQEQLDAYSTQTSLSIADFQEIERLTRLSNEFEQNNVDTEIIGSCLNIENQGWNETYTYEAGTPPPTFEWIVNEVDTAGNQIDFQFASLANRSYRIYEIDEEQSSRRLLQQGEWVHSTPFNFTLDTSTAKNRTIFLTVVGLLNGQVHYSIPIVSTENQASPIFTQLPQGSRTEQITDEAGISTQIEIIEFNPNIENSTTLTWQAYDFSPRNYTIYKNGVPLQNHKNRSWRIYDEISVSFNKTLDTFKTNITIEVHDLHGNKITNSVFIVLIDDVPPKFIDYKELLTMYRGSTGNQISWTIAEVLPQNYTLIRYNSTALDTADILISNSTWNSNIQLTYANLDTLDLGSYNFVLVVADTTGNTNSITTVVQVFDETPQLSTIQDFTFELGSTGNRLSWHASALRPDVYKVLKNGALVQNGTWSSGNRIMLAIDDLPIGVYNYTIQIFTLYLQVATDSVSVRVSDTIIPVFQSIIDNAPFETDTTGNCIIYKVFDINPANFSFFINSQLISTVPWRNSQNIKNCVDDLAVGYYNITAVAFDSSNNSAVSQRMFQVKDTISPSLTKLDTLYFEKAINPTAPTVAIEVADSYPFTYQIYNTRYAFSSTGIVRIDDLLISGTWDSSSGIVFTPEIYDVGTYYYSLTVKDSFGNSVSDDITIIIQDTQAPDVQSNADVAGNLAVQLASFNSFVQWTIQEANPRNYVIQKDGTVISGGAFSSIDTIVQSIDTEILGIYNYSIFVYDEYNHVNSNQVIVSVIDTEAPFIVESPENSIEVEFGSNFRLKWNITDASPGTYLIQRDGVTVEGDIWVSGQIISTSVQGLSLGSYQYKASFLDIYGKVTEQTITVKVQDKTKPSITINSSQVIEYGMPGNKIIWVLDDFFPDQYQLVLPNQSRVNGDWQSNQQLETSLNNLEINLTGYQFAINVTDTNGNFAYKEVTIMVVDTTPPEILTRPSSFGYEFGTSGLNLIWNFSDFFPESYIVQRNGEVIIHDTWEAEQAILVPLSSSLQNGDFTYRVEVFDAYANSVVDVVTTKIADTNVPIFEKLPNNITIEHNSTGNLLSWTVIDTEPTTYNISLNEQIIQADMNWISGIQIEHSIDGLQVGTYKYEIAVADSTGNMNFDTTFVFVQDTTAPTVTATSDYSYEEGSRGNTIEWKAFDDHPNTYQIIKNGSIQKSGTWQVATNSEFAIFVVDVDFLSLGTFEYNLVVSDLYGNLISDAVIITVEDNKVPTVIVQDDVVINLNRTGKTIFWRGVDTNPDTYTILQNNTLVSTGFWDSGINVHYNVDSLKKGFYNFSVILYDTSGNSNSSSIRITVIDTVPPVIVTVPELVIQYGSIGIQIDWVVVDYEPGNYTIFKGTEILETGSWSNERPISLLLLETLDIGSYIYTVNVTDETGNFNLDSFVLHIEDTTSPTISRPDDLNVESGSTENSHISWQVTDNYFTGVYNITINGVVVTENKVWNSGDTLSRSLDTQLTNVYVFGIIVRDSSGNFIEDEVIVNVRDTFAPNIHAKDYLEFQFGLLASISWTISDANPNNYTIARDGTKLEQGTWNSGETIIHQETGLSIGSYIYRLVVFDAFGNRNLSDITVEITDITSPTLNSFSDFTLEAGTPGAALRWLPNDANPSNFEIQQNGTIINTGIWKAGEEYSVSLETLALGTYIFLAIFYDGSENYSEDEVMVKIVDTKGPVIQGVENFILELGEETLTVRWFVEDAHPENYTLFLDGTVVQSANWINHQLLEHTLTTLSLATYNFTLLVVDTFDNLSKDELLVEVKASSPPQIISRPENTTFEFQQREVILEWVIEDNNPSFYEVYLDGVIHGIASTWNSGEKISVNLERPAIGEYNLLIKVYDVSGLFVTDEVEILVVDLSKPQVLIQPEFIVEFGRSVNFTWFAEDNQPDTYLILQNGEILYNETWANGQANYIPIEGSHIGGNHYILIVFDRSGNSATTVLKLEIRDSIRPVILSSNTVAVEYGTKAELTFVLSDLNPDTYSLFVNEIKISQDIPWNQGTPITLQHKGVSIGVYNYTLLAYDKSGNFGKFTSIVVVDDTLAPVFLLQPTNGMILAQGSETNLHYVVNDAQPGNVNVFLNGALKYSFDEFVVIDIPLRDLTLGTHEFMVVATDSKQQKTQVKTILNIVEFDKPLLTGSLADTTQLRLEYGTQFLPLNWSVSDSNAFIGAAVFSEASIQDGNPISNPGATLENYFGIGEKNILETQANNPAYRTYRDKYQEYAESSERIALATQITEETRIVHLDTWTSGQTFNFSVSDYEPGDYLLLLLYLDTYGNYVKQEITIKIQDMTVPDISIQDDKIIEYDYLEEFLVWNVSDAQPGIYEILTNGVLVSTGTWQNGEIRISTDNLTLGLTNQLVINVYDKKGNVATDIVSIFLVDSVSPRVSILSETISFEFKDENAVLKWNAFDRQLARLEIYKDDNLILRQDALGKSEIVQIALGDLSIAEYNYTIYAIDSSGNIGSQTALVAIRDTTKPVVEAPKFFEFTVGNAPQGFTWKATDSFPAEYKILLDQIVVETGSWENQQENNIELRNLAVGNYKIQLIVYDAYNNQADAEIILKVNADSSGGQLIGNLILALELIVIALLVLPIIVFFIKRKKKTKPNKHN